MKIDFPLLFNSNFKKYCQWFFRNIAIDGAGNIGGCGRVMNPSEDYGNIFKEGRDVWNNEYFQKMRGKFLDPKTELIKCCKNCVENQL